VAACLASLANLAAREAVMPGGRLLGEPLRPVGRAPEEALQALVSVVQNNGRGRLYLRSLVDPGDRLVLQILPATAIIEEPRAQPVRDARAFGPI
jgi:hypothetical protein